MGKWGTFLLRGALCCFFVSLICNCQISGAIFLHLSHYCILALFRLCSYVYYTIVCTFSCLVSGILTLCVHSIVLLISCNRFVNYLIVFFCQIIYFYTFCFLQVFLGDTCAFFWYFWLHYLPVFVFAV